MIALRDGQVLAQSQNNQLQNDTGLPQVGLPLELAQTQETNCRQTNSATGIYEQPNVNSASLGVLPIAQTVQLEVLGAGTGWARISQPAIGWIEARYLTPAVPCDGMNRAAAETASPTPTPNSAEATQGATQTAETRSQLASPSAPADASSFPAPSALDSQATQDRQDGAASARQPVRPDSIAEVTRSTCQVLPAYGLIVRSEPTVAAETYIDTILQGTYQFQFTRNTLSEPTEAGNRRWVYITAPIEGWILLGVVGGEISLGGNECG